MGAQSACLFGLLLALAGTPSVARETASPATLPGGTVPGFLKDSAGQVPWNRFDQAVIMKLSHDLGLLPATPQAGRDLLAASSPQPALRLAAPDVTRLFPTDTVNFRTVVREMQAAVFGQLLRVDAWFTAITDDRPDADPREGETTSMLAATLGIIAVVIFRRRRWSTGQAITTQIPTLTTALP